MTDIILYQDGLNFDLNDYIDTIELNKHMLKGKAVHFIMYSLPTAEQDNTLSAYLESKGYSHTLVLTPSVVLNENIIFETDTTLEARGLWNLISVIEGERVLFLRVHTTIDSFETEYCSYATVADFDLTGVVVNGCKFRMLMDNLRYPGYLTSDMVYLLLGTLPGRCEEQRYVMKKQPKPHQPASIIHFYNYLQTAIYPYEKITDRCDIIQEVVKAERDAMA